ncbi:FAD/NAD(P)-binding domain-containing protein [Microthyrium microscopicum]|uniref:FAD/NAD(P)-binding domain-containing protein n=1 Tax=Microthyrium microscopicum TaxID=703497 RepID=A0A6A6UUD5_9PEZI|nr:FAD/NAD(P)-binding domain-containing protein [Microthyrium microscopicum]
MGKHNPDMKKKVLVVGAGAAGMSCAQQLAEHPDKFEVTLVEAVGYCGGQAFSIDIDEKKFGAKWLNQGVQGGSFIYHHTMRMFERVGFKADPVKLQVAFGKDDTFWTNVYPTKLLADNEENIRTFKKMLTIVHWLEPLLGLLPIKHLAKLFWLPTSFTNFILLPMVALFLGTGNYTPEVPSIILERLCTSPTYGMWYPPDKVSVASNLPPMIVFPNLTEFYGAWQKKLEKMGVKIRLNTEVTEVVSRDKRGVVVKIKGKNYDQNGGSDGEDAEGESNNYDSPAKFESYDEIVLCVLADTAKRILAKSASFTEKRILGSCKFSNDITVTHCDTEYIKRYYEHAFNEEQAVSTLGGTDQSDRVKFAQENFKPMYLVRTNEEEASKLDLCFDCSNYQGQFPPDLPFEQHIFQTIFLNRERDSYLWTIDEIDQDKIIQKNWWHQLCHSWTHYALVVPWLWLIQGRRRTRFAASWTLVNAHEVACISGISAAVNLGAEYPRELERDKFAFLAFRLYYLFQYRSWYSRRLEKGDEGEGHDWATGYNGSVYQGPGVSKEERSMWKEEQA